MNILIRKVRSACYHAREWNKKRLARREVRNQLRACRHWLRRIDQQCSEVLVGANFVPFGGTRQHMHSLLRYSSLKLAIAPDDQLLEQVTPGFVTSEFKEQFDLWRPTGLRAD